MNKADASNTCEVLYKLRDAVMANNIPLALIMCREVNDRLMALSVMKEDINCKLNCEIKGKYED